MKGDLISAFRSPLCRSSSSGHSSKEKKSESYLYLALSVWRLHAQLDSRSSNLFHFWIAAEQAQVSIPASSDKLNKQRSAAERISRMVGNTVTTAALFAIISLMLLQVASYKKPDLNMFCA